MVDENKLRVEDSTSSRGAQWMGASGIIALAAQSLLNGGGLGGLLGGCNTAHIGGAAAATAIGDLNAKIAKLEAEKYSDAAALEQSNRLLQNYLKPYGEAISDSRAREAALRAEFEGFKRESSLQLQLVQKDMQLVKQEAQCCCTANATAIAQVQSILAGLTKVVIPNTSVCPGWGNVTVAPVTTTTTT